MQMFEAGEMKDKRYRLTGWTKAAGVSGWAGMWMRVDGPAKGKSLAFDNMRDRPIQGTEDWTKHEIVLDVPESATHVAFGVLLNGDGQIWMDDFEFEEVEKGGESFNSSSLSRCAWITFRSSSRRLRHS
ncbi:MAG: hypothetical protein QG625_2806 [Cyanobacteriota bacterium erpe_2018_sw_39hr_WHONDRS-SW48-000098_B_bin.30]|nr:hypothetical protein [Cyanobacteriota bacterium erpe_2018_sw_39hr_WHONDRS-SW48-000098_B_bin.30]